MCGLFLRHIVQKPLTATCRNVATEKSTSASSLRSAAVAVNGRAPISTPLPRAAAQLTAIVSMRRFYSDFVKNSHGAFKPTVYARSSSSASQIKNFNTLGQYDAAKSVWKKLKEDGVVPDLYTLASILATYRQLNDLGSEVTAIIDEVSKRNIVNSYVTNQIIDIHSRRGDLDDALAAYETLVASNLDAMVYSFFSLFEALVSAGRFDDASRLVDGNRASFEAVDQKFYYRLCLVSSQSDVTIEAFRFLMDLILQFKTRYVSDSLTANGILSNFFKYLPQSDDDRLTQHYQTFISMLKVQGAFGYTLLLSYYSLHNDVTGTASVWEELKQKNIARTHGMYTYFISTFAACCQAELLDEVIAEMKKDSLALSPMVLTALIRFYATHADIDKVAEYFQLLLGKDFVTPFIFNTVIDLYVDLLMKERVGYVIAVMKERCVQFNTAIYNSLMNFNIQIGESQQAISLFEEMKASTSRPNFITYKLLALAHSSQNNREQVHSLLSEMKERFSCDEPTFLALCRTLNVDMSENFLKSETRGPR